MTITDRTGEDDATFAALLARVEAADDAPESVRWRVAVALNDDGAYCGDCDYEDGLACSGCRSTCLSYADAALGVLRGEGRQA